MINFNYEKLRKKLERTNPLTDEHIKKLIHWAFDHPDKFRAVPDKENEGEFLLEAHCKICKQFHPIENFYLDPDNDASTGLVVRVNHRCIKCIKEISKNNKAKTLEEAKETITKLEENTKDASREQLEILLSTKKCLQEAIDNLDNLINQHKSELREETNETINS
jgi:gas vesicle protein